MTHNGKIARLPRNIRDELNHRLDDGQPGGDILAWVNALPQLHAGGGGSGINAQNLSNWRKGGYQDWLKQQERRSLVRELTKNAGELATDADGVEISHHLSAMLVAEFASSVREALEELDDPAERCVRMQEFLLILTRVRRQDNLAGKLAIERERRARERLEEKEKDDYRRECARKNWPLTHSIRRSSMADSFASPDFTSQAMGTAEAEALLRDVAVDGAAPDKPEAN